MQVILREDVTHLGEAGDLVNFKSGYARNFLFPRGLAVQANDRQIRRVEHEKRIIEARVAKARGAAEAEAKKLNDVVITVEKSAGENGKLFGSVTAMEIEALLRDNDFTVDRRRILLDENIKNLGEYELGIKLHRDVTATIKVLVVARAESE